MRRDSKANKQARRRTAATPRRHSGAFPTSSNSFEAQSSDRAGRVLARRASKALRTSAVLYYQCIFFFIERVGLVAIRRAFTSTGALRQASDEVRHESNGLVAAASPSTKGAYPPLSGSAPPAFLFLEPSTQQRAAVA